MKLRVGVIGTGYLGKFHAEKYAHMPDVELVGVVDTDIVKAEKVARGFNTQAFSAYQDLATKVDAVSIVVPTPLHHQVSKYFLENKVDVLIEKPMTTTLAEADELIAIAAQNDLIIQVGHLERFNPAVVKVGDILTNPMFIESHRLSIYKDRGVDVSVVLDLMIHDIDIILNFVSHFNTQAKIKHIHASGISVISGQVDIANARLQFENGCVANVTASRISTKNERKIRIFQRDAYVSIDFANHSIKAIQPDENQKIASLIPGMQIQNLNFSKGDALNDELHAFVQAVSKRQTSIVTGQMGRDALEIALSIMEQIKTSTTSFNSKK